MNSRLWEYDEVKSERKSLHNKSIVLVGGCFDLIHFGHFTFLKKAKEEGDFLIVALESDEYIRTQKKREPIHTQSQRADLLVSLADVDAVVLLPYFQNDEEYRTLVEMIHPDVVAITKGDPHEKKKKEQVEFLGGRLSVVSSLLEGFSTSKILETLT